MFTEHKVGDGSNDIKRFFENVFLFVCGILIVTGVLGLSAYLMNDTKKIAGPCTTTTVVQVTTGIIDDNLTNNKPTPWRRLNANGYSQRYISLVATGREARMIELLSHYDNAPNYETWKVVARIYRVYPEVLICIAYADSSLGNFLKTANNFGNVGNNDRGDTQAYITAEQGVNAIGKTLNNRNLGYINTIDMLSRYKNATGMVYATSPDNHFNNVANCIGMIRNKGVPDNFAFRW